MAQGPERGGAFVRVVRPIYVGGSAPCWLVGLIVDGWASVPLGINVSEVVG